MDAKIVPIPKKGDLKNWREYQLVKCDGKVVWVY